MVTTEGRKTKLYIVGIEITNKCHISAFSLFQHNLDSAHISSFPSEYRAVPRLTKAWRLEGGLESPAHRDKLMSSFASLGYPDGHKVVANVLGRGGQRDQN